MAGDANFGNVVLLLHCDGTNGSTTFTDASPTPKTCTPAGNAQISTAQSKFGGASATFDGAGDLVTVPSSTDFAFGTGDFTIELWFKITTATTAFLIDMRPNPTTNGAYFTAYIDAGAITLYVNAAARITGGAPTTGVWYHFAVCRSSGVTKMFLDGVQIGSSYTDATDYITSPVNIAAASTGASPLNGYIDDLRITKGHARYTTTFTPHTAAHLDYAGQVSGLVRDSANALCTRTVRAYDRSTGALVGSTTSNGTTGEYTLNCSTLNEVSVLCLDDVAGTTENDLVLRTTPA